jgi:hypothetical protein
VTFPIRTYPQHGYKYFCGLVPPDGNGDQQGSIVVHTRDHGTLPALPLTGTGG